MQRLVVVMTDLGLQGASEGREEGKNKTQETHYNDKSGMTNQDIYSASIPKKKKLRTFFFLFGTFQIYYILKLF